VIRLRVGVVVELDPRDVDLLDAPAVRLAVQLVQHALALLRLRPPRDATGRCETIEREAIRRN
jgi:hypothetical protein